MTATMRAAVVDQPGGPEVLRVREVPRPEARDGWTLVRVRAFGLNRSELMTRQGHSPSVRFPRILGIECVGEVAESTEARLPAGTAVAAVMGEMGRAFDGGYAEYALLPDELLMPVAVPDTLDWEAFAALPETYLTAYGSLHAMGIAPGGGGALLVRGGSSSVGLAAVSLAKDYGLTTLATTRASKKADALSRSGADHVIIDGGDIAGDVRRVRPGGPDYVLDLVGATTVPDSLRLVARGGVVCTSGMLAGAWSIPAFEPVGAIPSGTKLTAFHSDDLKGAAGAEILERIVAGVASGRLGAHVDRVFELGEIADAHRYMEANRATGKVVVRT